MAISGGEIVEAFSVLTGCPTEVLSLNDENFDSDITWGKLLSYASCNFPMGAGTLTTGEGIVGLHAYSILEVKEIKDVKLGRQQSIKEFFSSSKKKVQHLLEIQVQVLLINFIVMGIIMINKS